MNLSNRIPAVLFLLGYFCYSVCAQSNNKIEKSHSLGIIYSNYQLDAAASTETDIKTLKSTLDSPESPAQSSTLSHWVLKNVESGKIKAYADENLQKKLTGAELEKALLITEKSYIFDPQTFTEKEVMKEKPMKARHIKAYRLKQELFYNKKTFCFEALPLALAIIANESLEAAPAFWIEVVNVDKKMDAASLEKTKWAKRTYCSLAFPQTENSLAIFDTYLKDLDLNRTKMNILSLVDPNDLSALPNLDGTFTMDNKSLTSLIQALSKSDKPLNIKLIQDWKINEEKQVLEIHNAGFIQLLKNAKAYEPIFARRSE